MSVVLDNPLFTQEIPDKGASHGHIRYTLKTRKPEDIAIAGFCANVSASLLFERMQAQGTNILLHLTKDMAVIDVLARNEKDGLNLQWQNKQIDPAQLAQIQERIRNKTFLLQNTPEQKAELEKPVTPQQEKKEPLHEEKKDLSETEEDHLVKQLHRIP